ncbi:MAG: helix-turn-helix domain-containing protein [Candidatus Eremiobacteraeota bacterium]|nr:helix-turn-helix domain-containing protein [Candidatus Eremiobacteraeota bacterium]MBC5827774.1 helix-turn-helix domain-containing protein [Candidatus Eremiobacteraeota bacterium]
METIGSRLVQAREANGLTVADAGHRLHMRAMFVAAMERDDWATVGEPVYARGFLRNYARLLGLDADSLVADLDGRYRPTRPTSPDVSLRSPAARQSNSWYPWLMWPMSTIAALLVGLVVWNFFGIALHGHETRTVRPPATLSANPAIAPAPRAVAAAGTENVHRGIDLRLALTQESWLSVTVDGKRVIYNTLPAGTKRSFHGVHEILLRAGNAGGVTAVIDGRALGTLGSPGQVQERTFAVKTPLPDNRTHE